MMRSINTIKKVQHNKVSKAKMFDYPKKLDKHCSFEAFNKYMDKLVNEKFIDVQDHGKQELIFIAKELTAFLNISLLSVNLADKFTQKEVDRNNNETAIDSNVPLSDPEYLSDNDNISQVIRKIIHDTLAL